jgi:hypothetical protein
VAQKSLDTKDNTLHVECKVAIAPPCIVTATESGVEESWQDDNETSVLKEFHEQMGDYQLMKKDFAPLI